MSGMVVQVIEEESTSGFLGKVAECKVRERQGGGGNSCGSIS